MSDKKDTREWVLFVDGGRVALPEVCDLADGRYVVVVPKAALTEARDEIARLRWQLPDR